MSIRIYICPIVGDGLTTATAWRSKLSDLVGGSTAFIPVNQTNGSPVFTWALAVARDATWASADADSTCSRIFGTNVPDTIETWAGMKAFLQSKTIADLSSADRSTLNTLLTSHGLDTSQVTLATTWWQVVRGIWVQMGGPAVSDGIGIS